MELGQLFERESECEALDGALAAASRGAGSGLIFEGSAGIGKTALVETARGRASALGLRVLAARGSELERDFPFGVVRQLLEPPVVAASPEDRDDLFRGAAAAAGRVLGASEAPTADPTAEAGFSVLNGLHWVVAGLAERQPTALLIDDLHWADPASLRFIVFLATRVAELPCVIVGASRPGESEASQAFLGDLRAGIAVDFAHPRALSQAAVGELIERGTARAPAAEFSAACRRRTAGNPLFLRELVRAIADEGIAPDADQVGRIDALTPDSVAEHVSHRLQRLGRGPTRLAQAASVLGEPVSLALAGSMAATGEGEAELARRLREVEILSSEDPIRFAHPLVRQAIYESIPLADRDKFHQAAMEHFAAIAWTREHAAAHALSTRAGRGRAATVELLRDTASEALARGAPNAAIAYLRRALEEPPERGDLAAVFRQLGFAQLQRGLFDAADTLRAALDAATSTRERAEIAFDLGRAHEAFFDWPAAVEALRLARAELPDSDSLAVEVEAELVVTTIYDPVDAASLPSRIEFLLHHPRSVAATKAVSTATAMGCFYLAGDRTGAIEAAEASLADALLVSGSFHASFNVLVVLISCEEYERLAVHLERGFASPQLTGVGRSLSGLHYLRGWHALVTADLEGAIADLEAAVAVNDALDWRAEPNFYADAMIAEAAVELGDLDLAAAHVERLGEDSKWSAAPGLMAFSARAKLREARGELRDAVDDLLRGQAEVDNWLGDKWSAPNWLWRARAAIVLERLGERDEARRLGRVELEAARAFDAPRLLATSLRAVGVVEGGEAGISLLEEAVAVSERSPVLLERARCLLALGSALRRAGRRSDAREPLRHALDIASGVGAAPLATMARDELEASGGRPRHDRSSGPDALTPSERRITRLAADGLTNREIAQRLYLSKKTVEMHLSRSYRKLDISSRDELGDMLGAGATIP